MPVATDDRPQAIDLSHQISRLARSRNFSPLKAMFQYMADPEMLSLGGGLPHPSIFAFSALHFEALPPTAVLDAAKPNGPTEEVDSYTISHYSKGGGSLDLATALQYGESNGLPSLRAFARAFTEKVYTPAYSDYEILMNAGNTDGWAKVVSLLLEPGAHLLCEEHTYPSAQALWIPMGCIGVPIKLDGQGMRAEHLEETLAQWETTHPGIKRPTLMYIVPVGQNPTGATMHAERRQQIYDICVKYDVIICEDDPYATLQYPEYELNSTGRNMPGSVSPSEFAESLTPSFLQFDYQGRVIRLETFSKTLAPGCRLGFFVCNPVFAERLLRATEAATQTPSGFSQAIVNELLLKWGVDGYLQWLATLRDQYCVRRNWMLDAFNNQFDLVPAQECKVIGAEGLVAFSKGTASLPTAVPLFSFVPPTGGMFLWTKFFLASNKTYLRLAADPTVPDPEDECMTWLWQELAAKKVLLTPGAYYTPWQGKDKDTTRTAGREAAVGHFRLAFSFASREEIVLAVSRIAAVLESSWTLQ